MSATSYDAVPYDSNPFSQSQLEQLAAIATLFGLAPKLPSQARVLELGCATGGNIIPLAARYPNGVFLGLDLSEKQVSAGREVIKALGLRNIELRHGDITAISKGKQSFDYIICHGVYSWVPQAVQQAILRVCGENLAEQGVAYISYNVYPGWKMREVVRDAMLYHTRNVTDPKQKLEQARAMLNFTQSESLQKFDKFGLLC